MVKTRRQYTLNPDKHTSETQERNDTDTGERYSVDELASITFKNIKKQFDEQKILTVDNEIDVLPDVLLIKTDDDSEESLPLKEKTKLLTRGMHNQKAMQLSSSLDPGIKEELYFSRSTNGVSLNMSSEDAFEKVLKKSVITLDFEKKQSVPLLYKPIRKLQQEKKMEREKVTGPNWFNMPAPELTPEIKNDLKIIQMRNSLDPTHYYKSSDWKKPPKYFQIGTVVEGPGEFYSSRIPKRQRKHTIVEELLADERFRKYHKKKYIELQKKKQQTSGKSRKKKFHN